MIFQGKWSATFTSKDREGSNGNFLVAVIKIITANFVAYNNTDVLSGGQRSDISFRELISMYQQQGWLLLEAPGQNPVLDSSSF